MQNREHLFPAVSLEYAQEDDTVVTVKTTIRNTSDMVEGGEVSALPLPFVTFRGIRETAQWLISQMVWYESVITETIGRKANGQWK